MYIIIFAILEYFTMMERSPPNVQASASTSVIGNNGNLCVLCSEQMTDGQECLIISECQHSFHRQCIENHLSQSSECPSCKRPCLLAELKTINIQNIPQPYEKSKSVKSNRARGAMTKQHITRSHTRNLFSEPQASLLDTSVHTINQNTLQRESFAPQRNPPISTQQNTSPVDRTNAHSRENELQNHISLNSMQLNSMIENTVGRLLQNLNLVPPSQNYLNSQQIQSPIRSRNSFQNLPGPSQNHHSSHSSSFDENVAIRSDKITSIIQNWNVKYDGSRQGISVDEFLYRVRSLTKETFNNDFSLICKNLHVLLSGKARDWYWRYHKQVEVVVWNDFCEALKYQFKEFKSSFEIHEEIRSRKMKPNENFDTFYESVCTMLDKLSTPIPESDLVEILTRNLRPEIRHELLYIPIYSIAHLRKLVHMREHLMDNEYFRKSYALRFSNSFATRRQIAEVDITQDYSASDQNIDPEISIDAVQQTLKISKYWNCDQPGHNWEDCLEERNIFCYGCGLKNTYKPQCMKCASRKISLSKNQLPQNNVRKKP